jgi:hypothetical protein
VAVGLLREAAGIVQRSFTFKSSLIPLKKLVAHRHTLA